MEGSLGSFQVPRADDDQVDLEIIGNQRELLRRIPDEKLSRTSHAGLSRARLRGHERRRIRGAGDPSRQFASRDKRFAENIGHVRENKLGTVAGSKSDAFFDSRFRSLGIIDRDKNALELT